MEPATSKFKATRVGGCVSRGLRVGRQNMVLILVGGKLSYSIRYNSLRISLYMEDISDIYRVFYLTGP